MLEPAIDLAERLDRTEFVPTGMRGRPEAVLAAILTGHELGVGPMVALANIDIIEGRPAIRSHLMRALLMRDGHDLWPEESTATRCVMVGRRNNGAQPVKVTWTMDDAKRAGLDGKPNWKRYPRQMLVARATSELARLVAPDTLGGLYTVEELEDSNGDTGDAAVGPSVVPPSPRKRRRRVASSVGETEPEPPGPPPPLNQPTDAEIVEAFATPEPDNPQPPLPGEDDYETPEGEQELGRWTPTDPERPFQDGDEVEAWGRLGELLSHRPTDTETVLGLEARVRELFRRMDTVGIWKASDDPRRDALHLALQHRMNAPHLTGLRKAELVRFAQLCWDAATEVIKTHPDRDERPFK